jgi:nicotinate-nucleotide pyrophosphorylase (carboxylating)
LSPWLERLVRLALEEDLGSGDITSRLVVPETHRSQARIIAKQDTLVLSGVEPARMAFRLVDPEVRQDWLKGEGDLVTRGEAVCELAGRARSLLAAERVALNFLQRLSGIATLTRRFVEAASSHQAKITDTRKTTPLWRALEKAAVRSGGGANHRFGLYDAILIKDNHIAAAGGIAKAVALARQGAPHLMKIEVEVTDLAGVEEALSAGADVIMLDNMNLSAMAQAVRRVAGRVPLEASGGVNLTNVREIAATGVDYISVGALTHSAPAVDLSLEFLP